MTNKWQMEILYDFRLRNHVSFSVVWILFEWAEKKWIMMKSLSKSLEVQKQANKSWIQGNNVALSDKWVWVGEKNRLWMDVKGLKDTGKWTLTSQRLKEDTSYLYKREAEDTLFSSSQTRKKKEMKHICRLSQNYNLSCKALKFHSIL